MEAHVTATYGVGTWAAIIYANLLGIVNVLALMSLAIRTPRSRWPVAIMMAGLISGRMMYVLDSLSHHMFSPGESVFVVVGLSCSAYAYALFYFRVLDPVSLARTAVIEQMADGMFVLDLHGRIVDTNPAVTKIFDTPASTLYGRILTDVMPADAGIVIQPESCSIELTKTEISLARGNAVCYFSPSLTNLFDGHGEVHGQLFLLHDVTEQKYAQERLMNHQRVVATLQERERLARELHDSIGQVLGHINLQAQAAFRWVVSGNNEKATPILRRLVEVAQEAHADVRESILGLRTGMIPEWTFQQALRNYLEHCRTSYGIDTEVLLPDETEKIDLNPEVGIQVLRVIQEAMTNATRHGGTRRVKLTFMQEPGRIQIHITDDGVGFDPGKINPEAGNHFGLVFMRERMEQIGGSILIESQPGLGTTVLLEVPLGT